MKLRNILIVVALAGLIATFFLVKEMQKPAPPRENLVEPAANPFADAVSASGIIEAVSENIQIGTPTSGLVTKVFVKVWDHVLKDQPLFQLDDRELQALLLVQKTNIDISQANLKRLEDQLARLEAITDPRAISQDEVKTRQNDVAVADAQLRNAEAHVVQTVLLIERLTVRAPKDGVILQNEIRPGQYLQAGSSSPSMILGDLSKLQVRIDIDEQNASRIHPNMEAVAFPKNDTTHEIPLHFVRIEPYVIPKRSLTGNSNERVDTRVLQMIYSFDQPKDVILYVGQQVDVFLKDNQGQP